MEPQAQRKRRWDLPFRKVIKRAGNEPGHTVVVTSTDGVQNEIFIASKDQLGRHANEKRMPRWLVRVLESGDKAVTKQVLDSAGERVQVDLRVVETPGLVQALAQLERADPSIARATLCSPDVHHVAKLRREGSFCGYRNLQMIISYIRNAKLPGYDQFGQSSIPSIFLLQEMIEEAWEKGFNTSSRDELGPIYMTRKFIGTSEAEALLLSIKIPVSTRAFASTGNTTAYQLLVKYVLTYFGHSHNATNADKVAVTSKPPIFLQRPGHSMTIVGIDEDVQGNSSLIMFDPKYQPSTGMKSLALGASLPAKAAKLLNAHRYGSAKLAAFPAFEVVQFDDRR